MSRNGIAADKLRRKVSIIEAAEYLGVSERTIRNWIATGILPAYRYGPRVVRIDPGDLDALGRRTGGAA